MEPLILFGVGRILYSVIERHDKWFVISEVIASALFIGGGEFLLDISHDAVRGVLIGVLFIITGIAPRIILKRHPVEAGDDSVANEGQKVPIGIIDFVWITVMGGTLAFIGFTMGVSPFVGEIPLKGIEPEYYQKLLDTTIFLLGKTIDSVFLLGGALAGCMAILWAGEIWRKPGEKARIQYRLTTTAAIKMVVAFLIVALNVFVCIGVPLYNRMIDLIEVLR